jgi:ADP-ribosylglycohydrolase
MKRALGSLDGLSVGDAFGECFFSISLDPVSHQQRLANRLPPGWRWLYTDDTEMAMAILEVLDEHRRIDQDELAQAFALRYAADDRRGYGAGAHQLLMRLNGGAAWQQVSQELFGGAGSLGNGGAMRVAPLGAYFADDDPAVIAEQAQLSAQVTHAHPEGQAGAIAIALAAAWACDRRASLQRELFEFVLAGMPGGLTREGVEEAMALSPSADVSEAVRMLGNGSRVTAPDTVPFALWCAARHLDNYVDALWTTVSGGGDMDTNCAIVGGIVACSNPNGIPAEWLAAREPLKW